jgi:alpha-amylase/alpha-mannosidase (GH57 family)
MPRIDLVFLWHMHQPFYKDLATGQYRLPWTRMHALKDYFGMVKMLEEFPTIRQTFNLVPSMVAQIDEYAQGSAADPFLDHALKPAEDLSETDQDFILNYFFQANIERHIRRYPRYGELFDLWRANGENAKLARRHFSASAFRDLQVLSQLTWFDEIWLESDDELCALAAKGRGFTRADQERLGRKQRWALEQVMPVYAEFAARGQIELSTTPYYHPILPLLCDSDIARVAHPGVPLPARFRYPQDAREQLRRGRDYLTRRLGAAPAGLWPSEGSVSDEVLQLAAECGFRWAATDNGVLGRTLNQMPGPDTTYRPYLWKQGDREISLLFRDHELSDLIGFVFSKMPAEDAADHFLNRIRHACAPLNRDVLVPIILDGENAWEYYDRSGRPFLKALYRRIEQDPNLAAVTVSEALERHPATALGHIFPASWISANFDVWIGAEEDNRAWEFLRQARQVYEREAGNVSPAQRELAYEELLIAEGSDWCWWYGPEHASANRPDFDRLYRDHLANVYRALGQEPPEALSRPILHVVEEAEWVAPTGRVSARVDGAVSSYFEWLGAGVFTPDARHGAMHGQARPVRAVRFGADAESISLRIDFADHLQVEGMTLALECKAARSRKLRIVLESGLPEKKPGGIECAFRRVFEARVPLKTLGAEPGQPVAVQLSLWRDQLPVEALPQSGWIEIPTIEPDPWPA